MKQTTDKTAFRWAFWNSTNHVREHVLELVQFRNVPMSGWSIWTMVLFLWGCAVIGLWLSIFPFVTVTVSVILCTLTSLTAYQYRSTGSEKPFFMFQFLFGLTLVVILMFAEFSAFAYTFSSFTIALSVVAFLHLAAVGFWVMFYTRRLKTDHYRGERCVSFRIGLLQIRLVLLIAMLALQMMQLFLMIDPNEDHILMYIGILLLAASMLMCYRIVDLMCYHFIENYRIMPLERINRDDLSAREEEQLDLTIKELAEKQTEASANDIVKIPDDGVISQQQLRSLSESDLSDAMDDLSVALNKIKQIKR